MEFILPKFLFLLVFFSTLANAQDGPPMRIFQWKFTQSGLGSELPSCQTFSITVQPFNPSNETHGIPPFYMLGHEIGGTPRLTPIGDNETSLRWEVDHPVGTQLMLNVVDAQGSSGGVPPRVFTVVSGQSTNCVKSGNTTDFTVTSNITSGSELDTCQPWGLRIKGGAKPYNLTFLQVNSPNVTNLTMTADADGYTYINRANSGSQLLVSVSDVTGRWASGSPTVMPTGSLSPGDPNDPCVGLVSTSGNATALDQAQKEAEEDAAKRKSRKRTAIIAGVLVPILVLLIGGAVGIYYWRRRHRQAREIYMGPLDTTPKPFTDEGQVLSINTFMDSLSESNTTTPRFPKSPNGPPGLGHHGQGSTSHFVESYDPYSDTTVASTTRPNSSTSSSSQGRPGFTSFPSTSVRRPSAKAAEAGMASYGTAHGPTPSGSGPSTTSGTIIQSSDGQGEYIIQHRDGGGVVRELPPPYADRSRQES